MTPPSSSVNQGDATPDGPEPPDQEELPRASIVDPRKCPACLYSLCGLPARHVCPECGFEYDEHVRLWEAPQQRRVKDVLRLSFGLALLVIMSLFLVQISTTISLFVGFILTVMMQLWATRRRRDYIAVTSAGIFHRAQSLRTRKIPWPKVDEVWFQGKKPSRDAALFYKRGWFTSNVTLRHILVTATDRRLFAKAVEEGKRRYNEAET